jgi:NAD-dependent dihydropyrimidine dehydrogenase PreA subunit
VSIPRSRRERFPWFPIINGDVCLSDLECLNFCPAAVFDWDPATGKPVVARPFDCIPGCRSCAEKCKAKGISLPGKKEVAAALKRIAPKMDSSPCRDDLTKP